MASFRDNFSEQAELYSRYRPRYPVQLFDFVDGQLQARRLAWDCATGNGQAAVDLAERVERVVATDGSAEQLARAIPHPRVEYRRALAGDSGLPDGCADLITVATALHWFDLDEFYAEARRVAAPGALLVAWSYAPVIQVEPAVDRLVYRFGRETLARWWPPGVDYTYAGYRTIPFPFEDVDSPTVEAEARCTLEELSFNLRSWSAVRACARDTGQDPVDTLLPELARAWGDPQQKKRVRWPVFVRAGRVHR